MLIVAIVGIVVWLALGYLPSRLIKHRFVARYGATLGEDAWDKGLELTACVMALTGPAQIIVAGILLFSWSDEGIPLGWRW